MDRLIEQSQAVAIAAAGSAVPVDQARSALGKRAKIVSTSRNKGAGDKASRAGWGDATTTEKDQPLHVRLRAARSRRFQMQDKAAELAGDRLARDNRRRKDRVADCLRKLSDVAHGVEVRYSPAGCSAHYRGLQTCGSVWHCPVCAAKISEQRRDELARLVDAHVAAGGSVWMTTYTASHKRGDDLAGLVESFLAARRKMRMGRRGQALRRDYQVVGTVSVLEVTWSPANGWHPHVHELVFSSDPSMDPDAYDRAARASWKDAAAGQGLKMNVHGFRIDRTFGAVADYIAKFGHEPESKTPWGVESEISKGHVKQARGKDGMTPFGLLAAATDGLAWAEPLWREYAGVFKGRKQLNYSPGLKAMYQIADQDDEEIAAQGESQAAVTLVELTPGQWDTIVELRARGGLLEVARSGRVGEVIAALGDAGLEVQPPDMTGWRVHSPAGAGEVDAVRCDFDGYWRAWVHLDGQALEIFALRDLVVLSDGQAERAALLAEIA